MVAIKLAGPIDLERLQDVCAGVSAPVNIGADGGTLTLMLKGPDAAECAELLADWLRDEGAELLEAAGLIS